MPRTSKEQWEIQIGKNKHIISGKEKEIIVNAGDVRFVQFRDLVINPAFVADMRLISTENAGYLPEEDLSDLNSDEWVAKKYGSQTAP